MEEQIKVVADAAYPLDGILTLPDSGAGKFPGAVFVHGSGPQDKDETVGATKTFRDLADGFAKRGIASIRYDKRTFAHGEQMVGELGGALSVEEETIQDAIAAVKLLKADPRIDAGRIFIAGHSLGGMLAPRIDAEGADVKGLVILAGTMRTLDEVILDQNADALSHMDEEQLKAIAPQLQALEELKKKFAAIDDMPEETAKQTLLDGSMHVYAWYLKDMKQHPTPEYIKNIRKPILVLQGDKDVHVSVEKDFEQYKQVLKDNPNATCKLYPGLNHLFMKAIYGTINQVMEEYNVPQTVDAGVLEDITQWILAV
ncbi:MAG: alpha/beta fold hydrolase [Clostridiales bacterium]|nr:alpha/beta fold hydrolase [Clostridiales bacterium]